MDSVFWIIEGSLCGRPGPAAAPWDLEKIKESGIKTIISIDSDGVDSDKIKTLGFDHLSLNLPDSIPPLDDDRRQWLELLPDVLDYMENKLSKNGKVLIHCWAGKDRTGLLACSYLVIKKGLTPDLAIEKVRENRPVALSSEGYETFFRKLIEEMQLK